MKKPFVLALILMLNASAANSQEAFRHLSVGLDVATTGIGLELAMPVISDHLVLAAGYNFGNFNFNLNENTTLDMTDFSGNINQYVDKANQYLSQIPGESAKLTQLPNSTRIQGNGKVRLGTIKAILEYYPSKKSNFHINAGVYFGNNDIFSGDAKLTDYWNVYSADIATAKAMAEKHPEFKSQVGNIPELKATVSGRTFEIKDPGNINLGLEVAKVRPYLGIGFGRSIPQTHFGFQFDLGAIYTGKMHIISANEVGGTSSITINDKEVEKYMKMVEKICIYPQMSFRLIYRFF